MPFLSATVITRNEEHNIERCLNSLIGVADEIVVVDSHSTDATVEICRRYGAIVRQRPFAGYGPQRQYAATVANGNYILSIDADEMLTDTLRDNICRVKEAGFQHRMYCFRVVNYLCGKPMAHSGLHPTVETRLFDKRYANWDLLEVGERLTHPPGVLPALIEGDMHHFRCGEFAEFQSKELRHALLKARLMAAAGIRASEPMCWVRAAAAFVSSHLSDAAFMDGDCGRRIAWTRFRATLEAYRAARRIIDARKD